MKLLLVALALSSQIAFADGGVANGNAAPATQCDPSPGLDKDGMPLCPASVINDSAWQIWKCAYSQAKAWHTPTAAETAASKALVKAWVADRASGPSPELAAQMIAAAKVMGAEICRDKEGADSYLVVNAAPGVSDYSGGNLMLRETAASKVVIVAPHSDSDGYWSSAPYSMNAGSKALAFIGNGHRRGSVAQGETSDFVHHLPNLAYTTAEDIFQAYHGRYLLHLHGDTATTKALMRPQDNSAYTKAFMAAVEKETKVSSWAGLNAGFTTDGLPFQAQVKAEISAGVWHNTPSMARIVVELEKSSFLWDSGSPAVALAEVLPTLTPDQVIPMPPQKPHSGTPKLTCVSIKYSDGRQLTTEAKCLANAQMVSDFYDHNSRGKLKFEAKAGQVSAPYPSTASGEGNDMALIKKAFPSDYWILPRVCSTASHAGSKIAWICGQLIYDSSHEVGHLISLEHAGSYLTPDGSYNEYGDHESVMSRYNSNLLTAPQYYWEGWTPPSEVALFTGKTTEYMLKKVNDFSGPGLSTVAVPHEVMGDERDGFISFSNGIEFHLANPGGGSALVQRGITDYKDPSGLEIKLISKTPSAITFSVSITH